MNFPPLPDWYDDTRADRLQRISALEKFYGTFDTDTYLSGWSDRELAKYEAVLRCDLKTRGPFPRFTVDPPVIMYSSETPEPSLVGVVPEREPSPESAQTRMPAPRLPTRILQT